MLPLCNHATTATQEEAALLHPLSDTYFPRTNLQSDAVKGLIIHTQPSACRKSTTSEHEDHHDKITEPRLGILHFFLRSMYMYHFMPLLSPSDTSILRHMLYLSADNVECVH